MEELENRMRQVEILENLDLNKVLEELRTRDKKIENYKMLDKEISE